MHLRGDSPFQKSKDRSCLVENEWLGLGTAGRMWGQIPIPTLLTPTLVMCAPGGCQPLQHNHRFCWAQKGEV